MTSDETRRRAEAYGVATSYRDWHDRRVEVADETLDAIVSALESPGGRPPWSVSGTRAPRAGEAGPAAGGLPPSRRSAGSGDRGAPGGRPPELTERQWGFSVQLYSVRSRQSWGHGDLGDLADLATWSASDLGAGFILINPLHAVEPVPPLSASPYLPMTRRYTSPLYLRIEDIPEYGTLTAGDRVRIDSLAAPLRTRNATSELLDRDDVWRAKRAALEIIYRQPLTAARRAEFDAYRAREGQPLEDWALWCALAEIHGPDWRAWPAAAARTPVRRRGRGTGPAGRPGPVPRLAAVAGRRAAGRGPAGGPGGRACASAIIRDLAVGCHPGGADAWAWQDVLVPGMSVGSPPDEFNQRGQDWSQPPWHPQRLAAQGYAPLAGLIGAGLRHAGGLRADHVMGLLRLWWVPAGMRPDQGTYVRYDHEAMVGVLTGQAAAAGALAIGEDLGTVEPWIRDYLASQGMLGTSMLWFEREPGRRAAAARQVAAQLPGDGRHPRRAAGGRVRHRRAGRAAVPARPADPVLPGRASRSGAGRDGLAGRPGGRGPAARRARGLSPAEFTVALLRVPGPDPGPAARRVAGRRGRRPPSAEHARAPRPSTRTGGFRCATARAARSPSTTWPTRRGQVRAGGPGRLTGGRRRGPDRAA